MNGEVEIEWTELPTWPVGEEPTTETIRELLAKLTLAYGCAQASLTLDFGDSNATVSVVNPHIAAGMMQGEDEEEPEAAPA